MNDSSIAIGVAEAPSATTKKQYAAKPCDKCGTVFTPNSGRQKQCSACISQIDPNKASAERVKKFREREKVKKETASARYNSSVEISRKDARQILIEERGIRNPHVLDVLIDLAEVAAKHFKLTFNQYLFTHGLRVQLAAVEQKQQLPAPEIADEEVPGEIVHRRDLYALWDFGYWHQPEKFEDFLAQRRQGKSDAFWLGRTILGKDFHAKPHGDWAEFFPHFNPDGLRPGYSQEDAKRWLDAQSDIKERLILASRNAYKSTFSLVWALTLALCLPDARILLCSETTRLSKSFIKSFRAYWEVKNPLEPTAFQQLYPEYCIPVGQGSVLQFENPMAHLDLPNVCAEATSFESSVAGNRADCILFDDPVSNLNTGTEDAREKGVQTFDALMKLKETTGLSITIGTPWTNGDLFSVLIARNEADPDKPLAVRIDPAWRVKPQARFKKLDELQESDVDLLFPERLTWKFLQRERRSNERFFRMQNLCEWVPDDADQWKVQFDEDALRSHTKPLSYFDNALRVSTVLSVDVAFSTSRYADRSSICVSKLMKREKKNIWVVHEIDADRWRHSELAIHIVQAIHKWSPDKVVIERVGAWETLAQEIQRAAAVRGISLPHIYWRPTNIAGATVNAKVKRIKALEPMLANDELWFVSSGVWNDGLFHEMLLFDGIKPSNSHRKDDQIDSAAIGVQVGWPGNSLESDEQDEEARLAEEDARRVAMMSAQYARYFGSDTVAVPVEPAAPPPPTDPLSAARQKLFGNSLWR